MMIGAGIAAQALKAGSACLSAANTEVVVFEQVLMGSGGVRRAPAVRASGLPAR